MSDSSNTVHEFPADAQVRPETVSPVRPFYWSVRRELWENRSLIIAPLIVAGIVLFGALIGTIGLPDKMRNLPTDPVKRHARVVRPYSLAPAPIMLVCLIVGFFYAVDALHGERRDRSILFWKSLPVSDRTTVLAKVAIPLAVLPGIAFVLSLITITILLFLSTLWLILNGMSPAVLWTELSFIQQPVIVLYGLMVHSLWFSPIYSWLIMISAWAKRSPLLWALLPLLAISAFERILFNSTKFVQFLQYRVTGALREGFAFKTKGSGHEIIDRMTQLTPAKFITSPGLWLGLMFAAGCLAAALRLRRHREPI